MGTQPEHSRQRMSAVTPTRFTILFATATWSLAQSVHAQPALPGRPSNDPREFLREPPKPSSTKGAFSLVAIGDLLYSHPMAGSKDTAFQRVASLIKQGDVTIGNQEGVFLDLSIFKGQGYGNGLLWGEAAHRPSMSCTNGGHHRHKEVDHVRDGKQGQGSNNDFCRRRKVHLLISNESS